MKRGKMLLNEEKAAAMRFLIQAEQEKYYGKEMVVLRKGKPLKDYSSLLSLAQRLKDGILRAQEYEFRHPAIIPHHSRSAWLIMQQAHEQTQHGSIQLMMIMYYNDAFTLDNTVKTIKKYVLVVKNADNCLRGVGVLTIVMTIHFQQNVERER